VPAWAGLASSPDAQQHLPSASAGCVRRGAGVCRGFCRRGESLCAGYWLSALPFPGTFLRGAAPLEAEELRSFRSAGRL